jgi:hypothetical protein
MGRRSRISLDLGYLVTLYVLCMILLHGRVGSDGDGQWWSGVFHEERLDSDIHTAHQSVFARAVGKNAPARLTCLHLSHDSSGVVDLLQPPWPPCSPLIPIGTSRVSMHDTEWCS